MRAPNNEMVASDTHLSTREICGFINRMTDRSPSTYTHSQKMQFKFPHTELLDGWMGCKRAVNHLQNETHSWFCSTEKPPENPSKPYSGVWRGVRIKRVALHFSRFGLHTSRYTYSCSLFLCSHSCCVFLCRFTFARRVMTTTFVCLCVSTLCLRFNSFTLEKHAYALRQLKAFARHACEFAANV